MSWNFLQKPSKPRVPRVPDGRRLYAVGDVHGRADLLQRLVDRIRSDVATHPTPRPVLVFLGDYVDRGPDSRDVIRQFVGLSANWEMVFLKGNHEVYLLRFLDDAATLPEWIQYGGLYTLQSYGMQPKDHLDRAEQEALAAALFEVMKAEHHLEFFDNLKPSWTCGDFFFVHAGVRPGIPLEMQSESDLLYIRNEFLSHKKDFGKIVVHGHTPVPTPDVRANRINIDTGAFVTGQLTCLAIEGDKFRFL